MTPHWSVMLPVYRPDSFFEEALGSVLSQAPGPDRMQITIVNDCPTDRDVEKRVRALGGDRVEFTTNERNLGLAANWNRCIELARGKWVHLLHHDDRVYPDFYQTLERTIAQHPEAGAAFCANDCIDLQGNPLPDEDRVLQPEEGILDDAVSRLSVANRVQCPAAVVARSTYEAVGKFDRRFLFAVDWEMWVRIAHQFPVLYQPKVLASYRVHPGSETSSLTRSGETVRDCFRAIDSFSRYLPRSKRRMLRRQAIEWASDMAYCKAHQLVNTGQVDWAMALFRPALSRELRPAAWRNAALIWRHAIRVTHRFVLPPLPILPQSWFRAR
ncbi:family 2 glycosyl transferase [Opitutaceae bacterium EW11]|nr:family 2 glycosyl transferase [Opitutaceae bacterium EW11]